MPKRFLILMCSIFLIVPLLFMGCGNDGSAGAKGDKGDQGIQGLPGDNGAQGPAGPVTNTNESCMVCHSTGRIADITDQSGGMHYDNTLTIPVLVVDNVVVSDNASGNLVVTFTAKDNNGVTLAGFNGSNFRFLAADLVPAGTVPNTSMPDNNSQSTPQFQRWDYERSNSTGTGPNSSSYAWGTFTNLGSGNYAYTFAIPLGSSLPADNATLISPNDTQRLFIQATATGYTNGAAFADFTIDNTSGTWRLGTVLSYNARQFVTVDACKQCHGPKMRGMGHGSSYRDTRACVICHSPIINSSISSAKTNMMNGLWLGNWIHKIHSAMVVNSSEDFTDVTYPQDVRVCVTCHTASGLNLGTGNLVNNWENHPTAAYCGTCHVGFPNTSGPNGTVHPGGTSQPDANCAVCHPPTGHVNPTVGASVTDAHDTSATSFLHPNPKIAPEYDVTLSLSPSKSFYSAGDNVTVTMTLVFHGTATAVPASLYTHAKGAAGITDNILSSASVAIYGPRAFPKPIFAPTDNSQSFSLFMGTTPTSGRVTTDNTGFKYNFTVPSGLANGTYMVRARFGDYAFVSESDGWVESIAFQNIQIGNATVTPKVAGDACTKCHGNGTAPFHDARHVVAWDTDQCISCHDYSGGHAATLSNRVHAVHDANTFGDMINTLSQQTTSGGFVSTVGRDWSDVTYPQPKSNSDKSPSDCSFCHNSGNTSYRSKTHEVACLGCHGDNIYTGGATNHMLQNGGDYPKP